MTIVSALTGRMLLLSRRRPSPLRPGEEPFLQQKVPFLLLTPPDSTRPSA
ncbi:MAG: hypothetical protein WAK20_12985 [Candidatus Acidiferrum sp.]